MKKLVILFFMLAPVSLFAQKFGYVNSAEIIQVMPEYAKALTEIEKLSQQYTADFESMRTEFEKKGTEFEKMQQDSVPENILKRRYEELMQMQERLQAYSQEVQMNLQHAEQEKLIEIQKILQGALDAVGNEGGYVCVFDVAGGIPFINKSLCEDVTKKVRAKLGIPANAVAPAIK